VIETYQPAAIVVNLRFVAEGRDELSLVVLHLELNTQISFLYEIDAGSRLTLRALFVFDDAAISRPPFDFTRFGGSVIA
jgi:hypothetical protein